MQKLVGFVGWRGMVGSVLLDSLQKNNDFIGFRSVFFTTSQLCGIPPRVTNSVSTRLEDAYNIEYLMTLDIILSCQGERYTTQVYTKLQKNGWKGYWIDASSCLRMHNNSLIVLDPVNLKSIQLGIEQGIKTFVGGNCTVSLMLMALGGLFKNHLVDWISVSTYQSVSGSGSQGMLNLIKQIEHVYQNISPHLPLSESILNIEKIFTFSLNNMYNSAHSSKIPILGNLIPWIDISMKNGQTKEEWKGSAETNKILNSKKNILIDGTCVRVPVLRCHSQSFTIKLNRDISIREFKLLISSHNPWVKIIDNNLNSITAQLNPLRVSGTLDIPVGRIKKLNIGKKYFSAFSVGDQLLWGAAEPLRRMLNILIKLL